MECSGCASKCRSKVTLIRWENNAADAFEHLKGRKEVERKLARLDIKERKCRLIHVKSLKEIVLQGIVRHADYFLQLHQNPFTNLTNSLIQGLMDLCKCPAEKEKWDQCTELVKKLLSVPNSKMRNLNVLDLAGLTRDNCPDFVPLALANCPNLVKVAAPCPLLPSASTQEVLQLTRSIVTNWRNLRSLNLFCFFVTDEAIELISRKLPNLQDISLCLCKSRFSRAGTQSLINLKNLTTISLLLNKFDANDTFFLTNLLTLVADHPSLKYMNLDNHSVSGTVGTDFLTYFSLCCMTKALTLEQVYVVNPLTTHWPSTISVNKMMVFHSNTTETSIRNLCHVPLGVSQLILTHLISPDILYKLLEKLGPQLKKLHLEESRSTCKSKTAASLNLFRVMSLCPALEHFTTCSLMPLEATPKYDLKPKHFAKMKCFELEGVCELLDADKLKPFVEIFKMVLLGSKCYKVLELQSPYLLKETALFLLSNPDCLKKVEVFNAVVPSTGSAYVLTVGKLLMLRSPCLRRIEIFGIHRGCVSRWFIYLAEQLGVEVECKLHTYVAGHDDHNEIHQFQESITFKSIRPDLAAPNGSMWRNRYFPQVFREDYNANYDINSCPTS